MRGGSVAAGAAGDSAPAAPIGRLCRALNSLIRSRQAMRRVDLKRLMCTTAQARLEALRSQPYTRLAQLPSQPWMRPLAPRHEIDQQLDWGRL